MSKVYKGHSVKLEPDCYYYHVPAPRSAGSLEEEPRADEEDALSAIEEERRRQARDMMMEAEQFSADTRAEALRLAEQLREQARREGYQKGYEQGKFQALTENERALDELKQLMEDLDQSREVLIRQQEQQLIDLALEIARKVVADRIEQDDETFARIFKKAVEGMSEQKIVRLSVSEHDIEFVTAHADYLKSMVQDAEKLEVQVLEGAARGTLIVDTEDVVIDASVQKQLDVLMQTVQDARFERNT